MLRNEHYTEFQVPAQFSSNRFSYMRHGFHIDCTDEGDYVSLGGVRSAVTLEDLKVMHLELSARLGMLGEHPRSPRSAGLRILPVEAGIPDELVHDPDASISHRFVYVVLWRLCPHIAGRLSVEIRPKYLAESLGCSYQAFVGWMRELDALGWITLTYGRGQERGFAKVLLHQERQERGSDE